MSECFDENDRKWEVILAEHAPVTALARVFVQDIQNLLSTIRLTNLKDKVSWRWAQSGLFSVRSLYTFLQDGGVKGSGLSQLWSIRTSLKVMIFAWLVLKGKVLTLDNL